FSSRRRHTRLQGDWSSDVCSSDLIRWQGRLEAGETLLVLGAAGGVGLTAVEIGKAMGARVIAAASTPEKLAVAREHGADDLVNRSEERRVGKGWRARRRREGGRGR